MKKTYLILLAIISTFHLTHAQERFGGAMLYTVRDAMKEDVQATIEAVSSMGYDYVELAGYDNGKFYGMEPSAFKQLLNENGLQAVSSHQGTVNLENVDQMITDLKTAGISYFVIPVPPMGMFTYDNATHTMGMKGGVEALASILTTLGKKCAEAGISLLYHNHDFEFMPNAKGEIIMDYLLENTDPAYVNFQLDLFWITKAKADPFTYFEKYPGRFKSFHVKDMDQEGRFSPVGEGVIDFSAILKEKEKAGMQYYFVEQDRTFNGRTPLEALKISKGNLKALGFK